MNKKIIILVITLLLVVVCSIIFLISREDTTGKLKIYFFNAGKADSCIIYNDDFAVMIDTGEKELGEEILTYLENNNITKLDYLIITHFDKDHVGSASTIIDSIEVDNVIQSNYPKESKVYNKYLSALENKGIEAVTLREDLEFSFGDVYFTINPPLEEVYSNNESNNSSLIVSLKYKNNSFLFMGDAENLRIKEYLSTNNLSYDFLKVPYHGHYQTTLDELIEVIKPKYSVITSSLEKKEDDTTLELLSNIGSKTYLTRNGSILITSDGDTINIKQ